MPPAEVGFDAVGTRWTIVTPEPVPDATLDRVATVVAEYDRAWSRFRADSTVAELARTGGTRTFPEHAAELLDLYDRLGRATGGAVSPLVGDCMVALGYDAGYGLRGGRPVPAPAGVLTREGTTVTLARPAVLDVGAAGKGQLVDLVAETLRSCGIPVHVVDAGGDLVHRGPSALRVGLQVPGDPAHVLGVVDLRDAALCASATDRRAWGDGLHHVVDARTGAPTDDVVATWVVAERAMVADGLATALFLADPDVLQGVAEHTYVRLHADGRARYALGLPGEVFARQPGEDQTEVTTSATL